MLSTALLSLQIAILLLVVWFHFRLTDLQDQLHEFLNREDGPDDLLQARSRKTMWDEEDE